MPRGRTATKFLDSMTVHWRFNFQRLVFLACIALCAYISAQLFIKNLTLWPEYSFHSHIIWAVSKGYMLTDPFISGGNFYPLAYGAPVILFGVLLYPIFGVHTVALLIVLAIPVFWYCSRGVFRCLIGEGASLAAAAAVLNPFTMYLFFVGKLPMIWSICFGMMSIYFYLRRNHLFAALLGVLAVITHPISIFLAVGSFLLKRDLLGWSKSYFATLVFFLILLLVFFRPRPEHGVHITNVIFLSGALLATLLVKKHRTICCLGLAFLLGSVVGDILKPPLPTVVFDRFGFQAFLLVVPFLVKKYPFATPLFMVLSTACLPPVGYALGLMEPRLDDPAEYRELPEEVVNALKQGYVRYASDGSALYELPKLGIKFSNSGRKAYEVEADVRAYCEKIEAENASYVLVYMGDPISRPEQKMIREMCKIDNRWSLIYQSNGVEIFKTHLLQ